MQKTHWRDRITFEIEKQKTMEKARNMAEKIERVIWVLFSLIAVYVIIKGNYPLTTGKFVL